MIDTEYNILQAYVNALSGKITVDGVTFPVYSYRIPNDEVKDCIVITSVDSTNTDGGKRFFTTDNAITIEVICRFEQGGSAEKGVKAATEVLKIVCPQDQDNELSFGSDLQNVFSEFIGSNTITEYSDTGHIYRKLIRIRNRIHQKT